MVDFAAGLLFAVIALLILAVIIIVCAMYSDNISDNNRHTLVSVMSFACGFLVCSIITIILYVLLSF